MAPHTSAPWINTVIAYMLAPLSVLGVGAGGRAIMKQRELGVRLQELERVTDACPSTCAETRRCVAAQSVRVDSLEKGIERNYEAITALGERVDRAVGVLGERIDRLVDKV